MKINQLLASARIRGMSSKFQDVRPSRFVDMQECAIPYSQVQGKSKPNHLQICSNKKWNQASQKTQSSSNMLKKSRNQVKVRNRFSPKELSRSTIMFEKITHRSRGEPLSNLLVTWLNDVPHWPLAWGVEPIPHVLDITIVWINVKIWIIGCCCTASPQEPQKRDMFETGKMAPSIFMLIFAMQVFALSCSK